MKADVTGLILAGGRSRRFGSDKARYPVEGRPMIHRVYDVLAEVAGTVLLSTGSDVVVTDLPVRVVEDLVPGAGPLAGMQAGLRVVETPWLLVVACDLPFLTTAALQQLIAERAPDVDAVVAATPAGRAQPLCAVYRCTIRPQVDAALESGRFAVHALLDRLPHVRYVTLPEAVLRNVNRPSDLNP